MDYFGTPAQLADCEALLAHARGSERVATLATLAWYTRQRSTERALALARDADGRLAQGIAGAAAEAQRASARLALVRAEACCLNADFADARKHVDTALARFQALGDPVGQGDAFMAEAAIHHDCGDYMRRDTARVAAGDLYRAAGDPARQAICDAWLACDASFSDRLAAEARWGERLPGFAAANHRAVDALVEMFRWSSHFGRSEYGQAIAAGERAFEAALDVGWLRQAIYSALNAGAASASLNDHASALEWGERAMALARPAGWPRPLASILTGNAQSLRRLGQHAAAAELLEESMRVLEPLKGSRSWMLSCTALAWLRLETNDPAGALLLLEQTTQAEARLGVTDSRADSLYGRAQALSRLGRLDEALTAAQRAFALASQTGDLYRQSDALIVLAEIARQHGLPPPEGSDAASGAIHYMERAVATARRIEGFTVQADALAELSRDYEAVGDLERALACEREAARSTDRTHSEQAASLAAAARVRLQTERAHAQAEQQRKLAALETQRAASLKLANDTLEMLAAVGQEITASIDAQTVYKALHRHVGALLDAPVLSLWLIDTDSPDELVLRFGTEYEQPLPALRIALNSPTSKAAQAARERSEELVQIVPGQHDPNHVPGTQVMLTALFAPLVSAGDLLGVLSIQSARTNAYGERERQIARTLCAYGAVALANVASAQRLAQAQTELEHEKMRNVLVHAGKMVTIGRMASGVVHEMAHPVGTLTLLNETAQGLLARNRADDAAKLLQRIDREAERLQQLIGRLRDFARAGPAGLAEVDVRAVLSDARVLFEPRLRREEIDYDEAVDSAVLWVDPERLALVIANVVSNAIDAIADHEPKRIEVRSAVVEGMLHLRLSDSGPGLAPEVRQHLFEPFFTTKQPGKGLGLGLALSAESMVSMKARIEGANHPQGGAVFTLILPLASRG